MALLTEITVVERDAAWLAEATHYSACIFRDRGYDVGRYLTMAEAAASASYMNRTATNGRRAIVYGITDAGHQVLVPEAQWQQALAEGLTMEGEV